MNIESANFLALLPAQLATEGTSSTSTNLEFQAGFTEAFEAQLTQLSGGNNQGELLKPIQTNTGSSNPATLQSLDVLLGSGGDMQKLAAFFGKELPASYKVNDHIDLNTALSAPTDAMKFANINEIQGVGADQQNNRQSTTKDIKVIQTDSQPDLAEIMAAMEGQHILPINEPTLTETASIVVDNKAINPKNNDHDQTDDLATALLISLLSPVTASTGENNMPANSADLAVVKQQSLTALMKNTPENNGLLTTIVDSSQSSDNFLQKQTGEPLAELSKPAFNLNCFEKTEFTDKNGQIGQESISGGEKNLIRGVAEMSQLNRHPVEIRADVPGLSKPITHPEWNRDLGERILWMNNRSIPAAEIKLNPQHLGPMSVRVDINQDQATISFAAQHGSVREALEASIPKLRDMLSAQQLNLIDVNVSQHFSSEQGRSQPQNFAQTTTNSAQNLGDVSTEAMDEVDNGRAFMTKGLLSIYA